MVNRRKHFGAYIIVRNMWTICNNHSVHTLLAGEIDQFPISLTMLTVPPFLCRMQQVAVGPECATELPHLYLEHVCLSHLQGFSDQ